MKSGYRINWTDNALEELNDTIIYLEENWSAKELHNLGTNLEEKLILISQNPYLFQSTDFKKDIRRVIVLKYNTLYYRIKNDQIEIISFFSNRQNPKKRKLK